MTPALLDVATDLNAAGLTAELSTDTRKSALTRFIRVAALSGALMCFDGTDGDIAANSKAKVFLRQFAQGTARIADALGSPLDGDPVETSSGSCRRWIRSIGPR